MSLTEHQQRQLDSVLVGFDHAWTDDALAAKANDLELLDVPIREAALIEMVKIDIERQWRLGRRVHVEDYLRQFPQLGTRDSAPADLIEAEYQARRLNGAAGELEEYCHRFPNQATLFRDLIDAQGKTSVVGEVPSRDAPTSHSAPTHAAFEQVGRYVIEKEIGRGGMGVVLRGRDPNFARTLAVKVLQQDPKKHPDLARRFHDEAQLMGRLQHPGIPPVHERGKLPDGRPFFAMKQIQGKTLAELLVESEVGSRESGVGSRESVEYGENSPESRTPTTDSRLVHIFEQICQTMAYVHSQKIIHRDLKPANIMVGAFGEVQVMDWGLAKTLGHDGDEIADDCQEHAQPGFGAEAAVTEYSYWERTQAGDIMGTPGYMPPEQARGEIDSLDERSDVFSLGAILCEILTGKRPFTGSNLKEIQQQTVQGNLDGALGRLNGCDGDAELITLAKKCLAPQPQDRFGNAGEVADAVAKYQHNVQEKLRQSELEKEKALVQAQEERKRHKLEQAKVREERRRRRLTWAFAATALVLAIGVGALFMWNQMRVQRLNDNIAAKLDDLDLERRALHKRLADPKTARVLLNDFELWHTDLLKLKTVWQEAKDLAGTDPYWLYPEVNQRLAALKNKLKRDDDDRKIAMRLDDIRLEASQLLDGQLALGKAADDYPAVFADRDLNVIGKTPAEKIAAQIRVNPIRHALVAALDHWAESAVFQGKKQSKEKQRNNTQFIGRLLEIARRADPDPWRDKFRRIATWNDLTELQKLAKEVRMEHQSPEILTTFAFCLFVRKGDPARFLRKAVLHHRDDFWIQFHLSKVSPSREEKISWCRAALALRPRSDFVYVNLGLLLHKQGDLAGAIDHYQKAIDIESNNAFAYFNYGNVLRDKEDLSGAADKYRKALQIDRNLAPAHNNLGIALRLQGNLQLAARHFQTALKILPKLQTARINLGLIQRDLGNFHDAIKTLKGFRGLLHPKHPQRISAEKMISQCEHLLDLQKRLPSVLHNELLANAAEKIEMAQLCQFYLHRPRDAVRLYEGAFAATPNPADNPLTFYRYDALRAALVAADGAGGFPKAESSALRQKALQWFKSDLQAWRALREKDPVSIVRFHKHLLSTLKNPDFATVRKTGLRSTLPRAEHQAWEQFWGEISVLDKQLRSRYREIQKKGALTGSQVAEIFHLQMKTGKIFDILMQSSEFDTLLRLMDKQGSKVAENDDIDYQGGNLNSRIKFTPPKSGVYTLVATSFQNRGRGSFEITILEINVNKK